MAKQTLLSATTGSMLMAILGCDDIEPGSSVGYETAKLIYLWHPMGAKLAEQPVKLAMAKPRKITVKNSPETRLVEEFEKTWKKLECAQLIKRTMSLSSVYGASVLAIADEENKTSEPLDLRKLAEKDLNFNVFDPLNVAGSLVTNQNPNAQDFQKHADIRVGSQTYHRSRTVVIYNEQPIYLSYTSSSFGYVGRSVYQRALFQLKSFITSMLTDNFVQEKAGVLIVKSEKPGSIIDNVMAGIASLKRSMLKGAKVGNVLEIGINEDIASLNMQNIDSAMTTSRDNIIANIALAAGRPAKLLTEESFAKGFGEGSEDAKQIAKFIDEYREEMEPLIVFLDTIVQYRAWSPEFYLTIQKDFPEYQKIPYETAFIQWRNSFLAQWPNLLEEPESEKVKVEETKFKAVNDAVVALKDDLDPENKGRLFMWMAACFNEQKILFPEPLDLDFEAMIEYQEQQKAEQKEMEQQQMDMVQQKAIGSE